MIKRTNRRIEACKSIVEQYYGRMKKLFEIARLKYKGEIQQYDNDGQGFFPVAVWILIQSKQFNSTQKLSALFGWDRIDINPGTDFEPGPSCQFRYDDHIPV